MQCRVNKITGNHSLSARRRKNSAYVETRHSGPYAELGIGPSPSVLAHPGACAGADTPVRLGAGGERPRCGGSGRRRPCSHARAPWRTAGWR